MITGLSRISKPLILLLPQIIYNRPDVAALHASFMERLGRAGILYYTDAGRVARMAVKVHRFRQYLERHPTRP
jgi:hypothetical protein